MSEIRDDGGIGGRFGITLVLVARRWRRVLDERLASAGLTDATWSPLMHLGDAREALSQKELAARVGLEDGSLVRLLNILADRGLIERRPDPCDRRINRVHLTKAGSAAVDAIASHMIRIEDEILAEFSPSAIKEVRQVLSSIDAQLCRRLDERT